MEAPCLPSLATNPVTATTGALVWGPSKQIHIRSGGLVERCLQDLAKEKLDRLTDFAKHALPSLVFLGTDPQDIAAKAFAIAEALETERAKHIQPETVARG